MMKKLVSILLAGTLALSLAACGSTSSGTASSGSAGASSAAAETVTDPLALLETVWGSYAEEDKFSAVGGDMTEENMVNGGPGAYSLTDTEAMDNTLAFPAADADKIDSAASLMHMLNANTFTCGAYHVTSADDVSTVAADIKDNVMQRQWVCGFPEKLLVVSVDQCVVAAFGNGEIMDTFKSKLTEAYPNAQIISEDAIA